METFSGALSLFKGMFQDPELEEILEKIEISVNDSWLTVAFKITLDEIRSIMNAF
jgi:hypothetical protein